MQTKIRLQREEFDAAVETAALTRDRTDIGALVTFTGICRGARRGRDRDVHRLGTRRERGPADQRNDARTLSRHGRG